jgi:hypothetical protein
MNISGISGSKLLVFESRAGSRFSIKSGVIKYP